MANEQSGRRCGKTTRAMLSLPIGGYFVCSSEDLTHEQWLQKQLGRDDIKVVGPSFLIECSKAIKEYYYGNRR